MKLGEQDNNQNIDLMVMMGSPGQNSTTSAPGQLLDKSTSPGDDLNTALSSEVIIAIVSGTAGVVVVLILVAAWTFFCCQYRNRRRRQQPHLTSVASGHPQGAVGLSESHSSYQSYMGSSEIPTNYHQRNLAAKNRSPRRKKYGTGGYSTEMRGPQPSSSTEDILDASKSPSMNSVYSDLDQSGGTVFADNFLNSIENLTFNRYFPDPDDPHRHFSSNLGYSATPVMPGQQRPFVAGRSDVVSKSPVDVD